MLSILTDYFVPRSSRTRFSLLCNYCMLFNGPVLVPLPVQTAIRKRPDSSILSLFFFYVRDTAFLPCKLTQRQHCFAQPQEKLLDDHMKSRIQVDEASIDILIHAIRSGTTVCQRLQILCPVSVFPTV